MGVIISVPLRSFTKRLTQHTLNSCLRLQLHQKLGGKAADLSAVQGEAAQLVEKLSRAEGRIQVGGWEMGVAGKAGLPAHL